MSTNKSAPRNKQGKSNNSMSYSPGPREAAGPIKQISAGGLQSIKSGTDPEQGTTGHKD